MRAKRLPRRILIPCHAWRLGNEMLVLGLGRRRSWTMRCGSSGSSDLGPGVCGYVDDMISYSSLPPGLGGRRIRRGLNLFEYSRPALRWAGDIEDRIAATVHKLVKSIRG